MSAKDWVWDRCLYLCITVGLEFDSIANQMKQAGQVQKLISFYENIPWFNMVRNSFAWLACIMVLSGQLIWQRGS